MVTPSSPSPSPASTRRMISGPSADVPWLPADVALEDRRDSAEESHALREELWRACRREARARFTASLERVGRVVALTREERGPFVPAAPAAPERRPEAHAASPSPAPSSPSTGAPEDARTREALAVARQHLQTRTTIELQGAEVVEIRQEPIGPTAPPRPRTSSPRPAARRGA